VLRVGVIGAGANTKKHHIPKLQAIEGVEVTHVVNRSQESSQKVADEFNIPNIAETWEELVASDQIDAVCIGTWPSTHAEMTITALSQGKHVLVEARMAMNSTEAALMHQMHQSSPGLVAQVVPSPLTLKYDKTIQGLLKSGQLGELLSISVRGVGSSFIDYESAMHWRQDRSLSGNNMMLMGIFYEALMRWVGPAATVYALAKTNVNTRSNHPVEIPDHCDILCTMECGAQAHLVFSSVLGLAEDTMEFWLYGSEGTLHLSLGTEGKGLRVGKRGGELEQLDVKEEETGRWRVEEEFVAAIRGEEDVILTSFSTGVQYMMFTDAVRDSIDQNIPIQIGGAIAGQGEFT